MQKINSFIKNGFVLTLSALVLRAISVLFNIFLSNKINSSTLGIFGIIMSIFSFLLTIALSGINLSSTRLISEELSVGNKCNIPSIINSCFRYCLFFSIISFTILIFGSSYIVNNILGKTISINLLYILAIALPFCSLSSCLNGYFISCEKIKVIVVSQILEVLIQIFIVLFCYYINLFNSIQEICLVLILGTVLADVVSFLYLIYFYNKDYKQYISSQISSKSFKKEICKISLPVAFTTYIKSGLSAIKNSVIPLSFVSYGLSYNDALSYYGIISSTVMSLILFPLTFIQSYSSLLIPKISIYHKKNDIKKIITISKKSLFITSCFSIFITVILITFSNWIDENLYKTLSVEFYIKMLAPITFYIYTDNVIDSILKGLDLQVYVMIINIIDLIISIMLIKFLIPVLGIRGYIFVLYFSEIFNFFLSLFVLKRKFKKYNIFNLNTSNASLLKKKLSFIGYC